MYPFVEAKVAAWRYADLKVALEAVGGCYGPYRTMLEAAHAPVLVGNNPIFRRAANPSGFDYPAPGAMATIPQIDRDPPCPAPVLGAHSEEVLADRLGLTASMIGDLHAKGIVGIPAKGTNH